MHKIFNTKSLIPHASRSPIFRSHLRRHWSQHSATSSVAEGDVSSALLSHYSALPGLYCDMYCIVPQLEVVFFGLSFTCRTTDYSTFTLYADFEWWTKYFERLVYIATIFAKEFCPVLHDNVFVFFSFTKVSLFFMHLSPYAISFVDKNLHKLQEILKHSFEAQFKPLNYCMWRQPNCFMLNLIQPALRGSNCVMLKR